MTRSGPPQPPGPPCWRELTLQNLRAEQLFLESAGPITSPKTQMKMHRAHTHTHTHTQKTLFWLSGFQFKEKDKPTNVTGGIGVFLKRKHLRSQASWAEIPPVPAPDSPWSDWLKWPWASAWPTAHRCAQTGQHTEPCAGHTGSSRVLTAQLPHVQGPGVSSKSVATDTGSSRTNRRVFVYFFGLSAPALGTISIC